MAPDETKRPPDVIKTEPRQDTVPTGEDRPPDVIRTENRPSEDGPPES
jgi:hypothetical protein